MSSTRKYFFIPFLTALLLSQDIQAATDDIADACRQQTIFQEASHRLPARLLNAIGIVEAGRTFGKGQTVIWPWTLDVNGQSYFYPDKASAMAAIIHFQHAGFTNIDVGCMQINLRSHPQAFRNLDEALDPVSNVAYAAQFLGELFDGSNSWVQAIGNYHSRTPGLMEPYRDRVLMVWHRLKGEYPRGSLPHDEETVVSNPIPVREPPPPYPDHNFDQADPIKALLYYRERLQNQPTDKHALLGNAIAIDHLSEEGQYPPPQVWLAYTHVLMAAPDVKIAVTRLLTLIAHESTRQQIDLLQDIYQKTGGPAAIPKRLGDLWLTQGDRETSSVYYHQASQLTSNSKTSHE